MKKHISCPLSSVLCGIAVLVLCVTGGCRREDVREYTFELPGLTEANKTKVVEALAKYQGVKKDSYQFDFQKKTLTLKYDSMAIGRTNIRMAIESKGVAVTFPTNTTGRAGYIDCH